jgi:hypothetical protein
MLLVEGGQGQRLDKQLLATRSESVFAGGLESLFGFFGYWADSLNFRYHSMPL